MRCDVLIGDCIETMRGLPECSVHTCVTSPPYFGLRDYGHEGQIGLEDTPDDFVAKLVEVFREVRRVLRDDGTLWVNLGDSYAAGGHGGGGSFMKMRGGEGSAEGGARAHRKHKTGWRSAPSGFKAKDRMMIPARVALALQADGWYLRDEIVWHKPNPMPSSVQDRTTPAHEMIYLLSKRQRYFYDYEAVKEEGVIPAGTRGAKGSAERYGQKGVNSRPPEYKIYDGKRNRRSVWTVTTRPFKGVHFATFPPTLIEPCILAGCPEGGTVLDPFGGSGTTAGVALSHGRNAIICELNPEYAKLIGPRVHAISGRCIPATSGLTTDTMGVFG